MRTLALQDAFPVTRGGEYDPRLAELRAWDASGVYAILRGSRVLYVGESHSGRLYETITRHFRRWKVDPERDRLGRRRGGTTYDRDSVRVVYLLTRPEEAATIQYAEIQRLKPADNVNDGSSVEIPI